MELKFVTDHALKRFRARIVVNASWSREELITYIQTLYKKARPAEVVPKFVAQQLLRYGIDKETEYRMYQGLVFIVVENTLLTVHRNETRRWRWKKKI